MRGENMEDDFPFSIFHFSFSFSDPTDDDDKLQMTNEKWKMENGKWKMENLLPASPLTFHLASVS